MKKRSPSSPTSKIVMMFGCDRRGRRLRLPVEPRPDVGIVFEIGRQDLEGDVPAHRFVTRAVDDAHRAAADPLDDLVAADPFWRSAAAVSSSAAIVIPHCPEQRTTSAVMLSRLPCSSAVLISDCASAGSSWFDAMMSRSVS